LDNIQHIKKCASNSWEIVKCFWWFEELQLQS